MTPELIDNLLQVLAMLAGGCAAGAWYYYSRKQAYFILACFYSSFMMASLYWMLYTLLITDSPPMFYVSEMAWIACYLFLYLLQYTLSDPGEQAFRCRASWLALAFGIPLMIYFISIGELFYNLIVYSLLIAIVWKAIRGIAYWKDKKGQPGNKLLFHGAVLLFVVLENCLWLSSYPWVSDTWSNPYFWIDMTLSAELLFLLPGVKKAVDL